MKILFIYPDICTYSGGLQSGIGYISSLLKSGGHKTFLLHIKKDISRNQLIKRINKITPDMIAFSTVTNQYPYVRTISAGIKEEFDIPIICGGIHATLCPEDVLSSPGIDIVCVGEGEYPMLELANNMQEGKNIDDIQNLWLKKDGIIIRNDIRPLIPELDTLPFPDRDIFDYKTILSNNGGMADFLAGRGCPYDCTYCCNHALKKLYNGRGKYVRMRSVDNVLDEIRYVIGKYDVKTLNFHDDTFTLFPSWVQSFCDKHSKEFDIPFICNARADTINRDVLINLKKAGCEQIRIGIESGSEWLRENVLNRRITNEQIINAFRLAHEIPIKTYAFNMIGLPFETPRMIEETFELNKLLSPDYIQVSIFYPYPGTKLYEVCRENNFLLEKYKDSYFDEGAMINSSTLTSEQINYYYEKFKHLAFGTFVRTYHPSVYPLYKISKRIMGERLTENMLSNIKRIFTALFWR